MFPTSRTSNLLRDAGCYCTCCFLSHLRSAKAHHVAPDVRRVIPAVIPSSATPVTTAPADESRRDNSSSIVLDGCSHHTHDTYVSWQHHPKRGKNKHCHTDYSVHRYSSSNHVHAATGPHQSYEPCWGGSAVRLNTEGEGMQPTGKKLDVYAVMFSALVTAAKVR